MTPLKLQISNYTTLHRLSHAGIKFASHDAPQVWPQIHQLMSSERVAGYVSNLFSYRMSAGFEQQQQEQQRQNSHFTLAAVLC